LTVSPPGVLGDTWLAGEGDVVTEGEDLGEGLKPGPAGTACCGAMLAAIGSKGRLVRKRARKVASAAAAMTLSAIQTSRVPPRLRPRPGVARARRGVASTVIRLLEGRRGADKGHL